MALYEQWRGFQASGVNGWEFTGMTGQVVWNYGGTYWLTGWPSAAGAQGRAHCGTYAYDGSVYQWTTYSGTASYVYMILGRNPGGSELGFCLVNASAASNGVKWAEFYDGTLIRSQTNDGTTEAPKFIDVTVTYDSGTWLASWLRNGTAGSNTYGSVFTRYGSAYPAIMNRCVDADDGPYGIQNVVYPAAFKESIFDFYGTFNGGLNWGNLSFGDYAISVSDVNEQVYTPHNTRGWVSSAQVTMDNSYFPIPVLSDPIGPYDALTGWWANPPNPTGDPVWSLGTFYIRKPEGTGYRTILTGYVAPESVTNDYANELVTLQVDSVLGRASKKLISYNPAFMGTFVSVADGTAIFSYAGAVPASLYEREYLWEGTGTTGDTIRIEGLPNGSGWASAGNVRTGTVYVRETPAWMVASGSVYRTESIGTLEWGEPYPWRWAVYNIGTQLGLSCYILRENAVWMDLYGYNSGGARYYGGEKWTDVLHDVTASLGLSYSVDGTGALNVYVPYPKPVAVGTIDFRTAINDEWTLTNARSIQRVTVQTALNPVTGSYSAESVAEQSDVSEGQVIELQAPWIPTEAYGRALAYRTMAMGAYPLDRLALTLEGSLYGSYTPGDTVVVTNRPFNNMANALVIAGRTYSFDSDTVTLDLMEQRTFGVFTFDVSTWDGDDLWW